MLVSKGYVGTGATVSSGSGPLLMTLSGFVTLQQSRPVLMFVVPDTIKGNADARGLGDHLWPC